LVYFFEAARTFIFRQGISFHPNNLTLWRLVEIRDFREKATEMHVALRGNFFSPVNATDLVKAQKMWEVL